MEKLAFGNPHFSWKLSELLLILVAKEEDFDNLDDLEASSESCGGEEEDPLVRTQNGQHFGARDAGDPSAHDHKGCHLHIVQVLKKKDGKVAQKPRTYHSVWAYSRIVFGALFRQPHHHRKEAS